jgi:hypothetical protein
VRQEHLVIVNIFKHATMRVAQDEDFFPPCIRHLSLANRFFVDLRIFFKITSFPMNRLPFSKGNQSDACAVPRTPFHHPLRRRERLLLDRLVAQLLHQRRLYINIACQDFSGISCMQRDLMTVKPQAAPHELRPCHAVYNLPHHE